MTERRRQEDRIRTTRAGLVAAGRRLFAERGYAEVTAEEIVAAAGLTRGALRHHFGDKRGLFETVFEEVETEVTQRTTAALGTTVDTWEHVENGIITFLDLCQDPEVIKIAMTDAPTVLGWETWREVEARYGLGLIQAAIEQAAHAGVIAPQPVEPLAHLVLSAVIEAAMLIARSPDIRPDTEQALLALIRGLRAGA